MFSKKLKESRAQLFLTLKVKLDRLLLRPSITSMLKTKRQLHQLSSTKFKRSPTIKINLSFLFTLDTEPTKSSLPQLIRNLSLNLKRGSKRPSSYSQPDVFNPDGLNKTESSKSPTAELFKLSTPLSLTSFFFPESSLDSEPESDLMEPHFQRSLWTRLNSTSLRTELVPLELPTEN